MRNLQLGVGLQSNLKSVWVTDPVHEPHLAHCLTRLPGIPFRKAPSGSIGTVRPSTHPTSAFGQGVHTLPPSQGFFFYLETRATFPASWHCSTCHAMPYHANPSIPLSRLLNVPFKLTYLPDSSRGTPPSQRPRWMEAEAASIAAVEHRKLVRPVHGRGWNAAMIRGTGRRDGRVEGGRGGWEAGRVGSVLSC